jgi:hypothetical protein
MKTIVGLAAGIAVLHCAVANAATMSIITQSNGANRIYTIYLAGGPDNGNFNTVILEATPTAGKEFLNFCSGLSSGAPRPPGTPFTYRNRALDIDPADPDNPGIGLGWSLLGVTNTATKQSFTGGPLGQNISTASQPQGRLFLANLYLNAAANGLVKITGVNSGGGLVFAIAEPLLDPEPTAAILAGTMALALTAFGRRRKARCGDV